LRQLSTARKGSESALPRTLPAPVLELETTNGSLAVKEEGVDGEDLPNQSQAAVTSQYLFSC
jgi:hypothetical protein